MSFEPNCVVLQSISRDQNSALGAHRCYLRVELVLFQLLEGGNFSHEVHFFDVGSAYRALVRLTQHSESGENRGDNRLSTTNLKRTAVQ